MEGIWGRGADGSSSVRDSGVCSPTLGVFWHEACCLCNQRLARPPASPPLLAAPRSALPAPEARAVDGGDCLSAGLVRCNLARKSPSPVDTYTHTTSCLSYAAQRLPCALCVRVASASAAAAAGGRECVYAPNTGSATQPFLRWKGICWGGFEERKQRSCRQPCFVRVRSVKVRGKGQRDRDAQARVRIKTR
ncbi:hypothetical protein LY76DRAFT_589128 [Colletotrichum caudatum]|nr:hypothetical protein LY76DRAFT_589128 [Colletotrichum caudatum]